MVEKRSSVRRKQQTKKSSTIKNIQLLRLQVISAERIDKGREAVKHCLANYERLKRPNA